MRLHVNDLPSLILIRKEKGDEVYLCPFCLKVRKTPDKKGHLFVNKNKWGGVWHCYRCDSSGIIEGMLVTNPDVKWVKSLEKEEIRKPELPQDFVPLSESKEDFFPVYKEYAEKRGITEDLIEKFNVGFTVGISGPFAQRLIFSFYDSKGNLSFIQGRAINKKIEPRYFSRGKIILAKSFEGSVDSGAVLEGIFDMAVASKYLPSAAIFRHRLQDPTLIKSIRRSFRKRIFLIVDSDVPGAIIPFIKAISDREVVPLFLRKKDISEYGEEERARFFGRVKRLMEG